MTDDDFTNEGGLVDRIKESPRTVSALIIILIVAAAIYAFSGDEASSPEGELAEQAAVTESGDTAGAIEAEADGEAGVEADKLGQVAAVTTDESVSSLDEAVADAAVLAALQEPSRTDKAFVEVAEPGNGITHLARRATTRWLSENQAGFAVTDEHRIYIEDFVQNRLGTQGLALGETMEIEFSLVQEAVAAAAELNEQQLQNLSQFTTALQ